MDGVPPAERDKPENAITLADWIRQCRRAGLFELGRVLYERGGINMNELSEESQLELDEDYQLCFRRCAKEKGSVGKGRKSSGKDQLTLEL